MLILSLTFLTVFLAVFAVCLIATDKLQQQKDLKLLAQRREERMIADNHAAWVRNRTSIMH